MSAACKDVLAAKPNKVPLLALLVACVRVAAQNTNFLSDFRLQRRQAGGSTASEVVAQMLLVHVRLRPAFICRTADKG